jgi:hypothetical protein
LTIRLTTTAVPDGTAPEKLFEREGLTPHSWGNGPGDVYGWHAHAYDKVLICVQGGITFHGRDGDFTLAAGDRLDIEAGTEHAATVGYEGVECMEAAR